MTQKTFLPMLRELARTYQAFESYSAAHVRTLNITPPQFDIIATLGNTQGMSFKELGDRTLITKGTLTGVVDRLAAKNIVRRTASPSDGRSQIVQLTPEGEALFSKAFPAHIEHVGRAFNNLSQAELDNTEAALSRLREALTVAGTS